MKTSYLNNITEETLRYRNKLIANVPEGSRLRSARVNHLMKLIRYRNRAYDGGKHNDIR